MRLLWLAWRNIRYYRDISVMIITSIAIAVALLWTGVMVDQGVHRSLEVYRERFGADLLVIPEGAQKELDAAFWLGEPVKHYFDSSILARLSAIKGIKQTSPQVYLESAAASCCTTGNVFLIGFEPSTDFTLLPWIGSGRSGKFGPDDAVVGANITQPVGLHLVFYNHRFKIAAQLARTGLGIYDNAVYLPLKTVYRMAEESRTRPQTSRLELKNGSISTVLVRLKKNASTAEVSREIERQNPGLKVIGLAGLAQVVRGRLPELEKSFTLWAAAVWAGVLFFIAVIFYLFNRTRRREHGLLRAMGGSRTDLVKLSLLEGVVLTACGGTTGILISLVLKVLFYNWLVLSLKMPLLYPAFIDQFLYAVLLLFVVTISSLAAMTCPVYVMAFEEPYKSIRSSG